MKKRLTRDTVLETLEFVKANKLGPHQRISINHQNCPAGEDSRRRLYASVSEDGKLLLLHCFNCGSSGVTRYRATASHDSMSLMDAVESVHKEMKFKTEEVRFSHGELLSDSSWPCGYFLNDEVAKEPFNHYFRHLFRVLPNRDNAVMLLRGDPSNVTGYDTRFFNPKGFTRTYNPIHDGESNLLVYAIKPSNVAVVVEDPISAMKVAIAGYTGIALCGSSMRESDYFKVASLYENVVVWLDNDSALIKKQASTMYARMGLFNENVFLIGNREEPKKLTCELIAHAIELAILK